MLQTSHSCFGKLQLALLLMIIMLIVSTRYTQGNDCDDDSTVHEMSLARCAGLSVADTGFSKGNCK